MSFFRGISVPAGRRFGHRAATLFLSTLPGLLLSQSAFAANITVASPVSGARVASTLWVRAHNTGCNGLGPKAFGYSIDNSSAITWGVTAYDIDVTKVAAKPGAHVVHFKSWTARGLCPVVNAIFTASAPTSVGSSTGSGSGSTTGGGGSSTGSGSGSNTSGGGSSTSNPSPGSGDIPTNAVSSGYLDGKVWAFEKDEAVSGGARGSSVFPATTPLYDEAREFYMTYSQRGAVRWHISFANDTKATHFVYDTYVYIVDPTQVANLELDMNQVMSDGRTVIFGTQCSVYSKTWEYTLVAYGTQWHPSNIPCNPQNWAAKTWHHVQIASHRDDKGNVTYDWVNLDGVHSEFVNATVNSAEALGWQKGTLLINFQLDGASKDGGTITAYAHNVTVLRW
ncbi:MAG TPA: hypothetical protein VK638_50145 [Edaphobacter sp.]|nr:hypothetical protein [Edaphobacter sp.]